MEYPKIGIVILNYQSWQDTLKVVSNLSKQKKIDIIFSIVDNNSPNNSFSILKEAFHDKENVILTKNNENSGYAKGNNLGLKILNKYKCDFVIICNNDIIVEDDNLLYKLSNIYSKLDNPGFIAPRQKKITGEYYVETCYKIPTFKYDIMNQFVLTRWINIQYHRIIANKLCKKNVAEVEIFTGSFLFIDYSYFYSINFFDEDTFLYGEERFWAKKLKNAKKKCYIINNLSLIHAHSQTINKYISRINQLQLLSESIIKFNNKYRSLPKVKNFIFKACFKYCKLESKIIYTLKNILNRR